MQKEQNSNQRSFFKRYSVAIETVPLPEKPADLIDLVMKSISPVFDQILHDAMTVAIGTWPTPEKPRLAKEDRSQSVQEKASDLSAFKTSLIENRSEFEKQLKEVNEQFPLVVLAMEIQKATIKDILENSHVSSLESVQLYEALFDDPLMQRAEIEQNQRLTKLKSCLATAKTDYKAGMACFEEYNQRDYP